MREPVVSVVIPVYNGEKYLESCLENLMSQTYKSIDIIVVDDRSTDQSAEITRKYPVRLISHEKNLGPSAARNTGIDAAKGKYIHFMDVDDGVNSDYYRAMVEAITTTEADVACGGMVNERNRLTQIFRKRKTYTSTEDKLRITYVGKWGYVWRYLFRLDFLKQHGLRFEEGRLIEDTIFSLSAIYYARKLVIAPSTKYIYYKRENSLLNRKDEEYQKKTYDDWLHTQAILEDFCMKKEIKLPGIHTGRLSYTFQKVTAMIRYRL